MTEALRIPESWLPELMAAALDWRGIQDPAGLAPGWRAYQSVLARGGDHLPLFLILDLAALLRLGWDSAFTSDHTNHNKAPRLRYESEVLARLLQEGLIEALRDRGAGDPGDLPRRDFALSLLTRRLAPLYPPLARVNPAELRALPAPDPDAADRAAAILAERDERDLLQEGLAAFLDAAAEDEAWCRSFDAAELFELRHLSVLDSEDARIGCRQALQLDAALGPADPRAFPVLDDEAAEAETAFIDDSRFPSGGFSELTRRGSIENLVKSELVYMDEAELSLFDLRAAEGELLYYLRDSGSLLRRRRSLLFIIDAPRLYHEKAARFRWPYSTLLLGLCRRLACDLFAIYKGDAVEAAIRFLEQAELELQTEVAVLDLLLADERAAGLARVELAPDKALAETLPGDRLARVIIFTDRRAAEWKQRLDALALERPGARGLVIGIGGEPGDLRLPSSGLDDQGLRKLRDALLRGII